MANQTYLPRADKDKVVWFKNFATKFSNLYGASLGFTAPEITAINNDAVMFTYIVDMVELFKAESAKRVAYKNMLANSDIGTPISNVPAVPPLPVAPGAVPAGIFKRLAKTVQRIKNHPAYNEAIGQDLNIIAAVNSVDVAEMKPLLKPGLDAGRPLIKWKKGDADSIDIYVDRKDAKGFVFLANDSQPDYVDTFELSPGIDTALWSYKGIYKIADEHVGEFSEPISITVTRNVNVV
jgi:hypothetical protein